MAEDGIAICLEYKEKFEELGGIDLPVSLIMITPSTSIMGTSSNDELDFENLVILNEEGTLNEFQNLGITVFDKMIFTVWGGILDLDTDGETPLGRSDIIVEKLKLACNPGGGVKYGDITLPMITYRQGLIIGGVVLEWHLICESRLFNSV